MGILKSNLKRTSKSEKLIYIIIFLWVVFGILGIKFQSNLAQIAGYYASLTLFVATYLWGEFKRGSRSNHFFKKGHSSSREIVIYATVGLWTVFGIFGIVFGADINQLTVYFAALTPFVSSYIIYKTSKGNDLPIFNGKSQEMVDNNINSADNKTSTIITNPPKKETTPVKEENVVITDSSKEDETIEPEKPKENEGDIEDEVF
jgi:hypothetical protein